MNSRLCVGLTATRGAWSAELRAYLRDHSQGISVQVIMDRANLQRVAGVLDVLVLDDLMRLFTPADIARLSDEGVTVFAICHPADGMGRQHLTNLGVEHVLMADTSPAEIASLFSPIVPRQKRTSGAREWGGWPSALPPPERRRNASGARVSVWTKVNGGAGLTEAVIAVCEHLAAKSRVLLIELEEMTPVLVSRLLRSPDTGLAYALARASGGATCTPGRPFRTSRGRCTALREV